MQGAADQFGSVRVISSYALTADSSATPYRYCLYLELMPEIAIDALDCDALVQQFDQHLQEINLSYKTIGRKTGRLGLPQLVFVAPGTFAKLEDYQYRSAPGVSRNQVKVPLVLKNPKLINLLEADICRKTEF
jgi:hypothetical protein